MQFHVNVHNSIQTASNVILIEFINVQSAASSIEKRRGRRSTVDDYNNFDVMDMDMGPFDERYKNTLSFFNRLTDVPVVDSSIALDSTSGLNLMRSEIQLYCLTHRNIKFKSIIFFKYSISPKYNNYIKVFIFHFNYIVYSLMQD